MIPREQFEKMAVLALVAILLLAVFSIQAFATDMDDGLEKDTSYHDSGILPGYPGGSFPEDVAAIRRDLEILLYFVVPASAAILFVYLLGRWFYSTFVASVL